MTIDKQKRKVYKAEALFCDTHEGFWEFDTAEDCYRYLVSVLNLPQTKVAFTADACFRLKKRLSVSQSNRRKWCTAYWQANLNRAEIGIGGPAYHKTASILLHELAHLLNQAYFIIPNQSHGRHWAWIRLTLEHIANGERAYHALRAAFLMYDVKFFSGTLDNLHEEY